MSFRLTRAGVILPSSAELAQLCDRFARQHCVRFDAFLEPALLGWLRAAIASGRFVTRVHTALTPPVRDLVIDDALLISKLFLITNDARLFETVQAITGCGPIGSFAPVVMRQDPHDGHHDAWHGDVDGNRLVALSVNVGGRFEGSALQVRDYDTGRPLHEDSNAEPGSALLFRIFPSLQHRVTPLEGAETRTVLVGWFLRQPVLTSTGPVST